MTATELKAGSNLEKVFAAGAVRRHRRVRPAQERRRQRHREEGQDAGRLRRRRQHHRQPDRRGAHLLHGRRAAQAQQNGLEAIMQMTCRDRNRLAMQADILGASVLGIKNILCLTGDHMSFGNHPEAKGVHDLDADQPDQDVQGHAGREEVPVRRGDGRRAAPLHRLRREPVRRPLRVPRAAPAGRRSRPAPTSCRPSASSTSPSSRSG